MGWDTGECPLDFLHRFNRLLANEFQSDVQRFRTNPASVRGKPAYPFQKAMDALSDGVVDVEGDENAHDGRWSHVVSRWLEPLRPTANDQRPFYISFLLTISIACWLAKRRMRLRSPGNLRSATSVSSSLARAWKTSPTGFSAVPPVGPATPVIPTPRVAPVRRRIPSARAAATSLLTAPCFSIRSAGTSAKAVFN